MGQGFSILAGVVRVRREFTWGMHFWGGAGGSDGGNGGGNGGDGGAPAARAANNSTEGRTSH